jgi:hypothetical protein
VVVEPVRKVSLCHAVVGKHMEFVIFAAQALRPIEAPDHRKVPRKPFAIDRQ